MKRQWNGFVYDYVDQQGTCLLVQHEQRLTRDMLKPIELRMLETCRVPHVLPFELEEVDGEARLRYRIGSSRPLSEWSKQEALTPHQLLRYLLLICAAVEACGTYMLREDAFWLHPDVMYVEEEGMLSLLYVPVADHTAWPSAWEQLQQLIEQWSNVWDGDRQTWLSCMRVLQRKEPSFSQLGETIRALLTKSAPTSTPALQPDHQSPASDCGVQQRAASASAVGSRAELLQDNDAHTPPPHAQSSRMPAAAHTDTAEQQKEAGREQEHAVRLPAWITARADEEERWKPLRTRLDDDADDAVSEQRDADQEQHAARVSGALLPVKQRIYIGSAAFALLLLLWSLYPNEAREQDLYIWSGMTILLLDAVFVLLQVKPALLHRLQKTTAASGWNRMEERGTEDGMGRMQDAPVLDEDIWPLADSRKERSTAARWHDGAARAKQTSAEDDLAEAYREDGAYAEAGVPAFLRRRTEDSVPQTLEHQITSGQERERHAQEAFWRAQPHSIQQRPPFANQEQASDAGPSSQAAYAATSGSSVPSASRGPAHIPAAMADPVVTAQSRRTAIAAPAYWNETTLLHRPDATVLLHPHELAAESETPDSPERHPPILEIEAGQQKRRVPLEADSFVIGRDPARVQYVADVTGISKLHAEIVREADGYYVKDVGSKNGSTLNGQSMVPYKLYPFADGDALQLVSVKVVFCAVNER